MIQQALSKQSLALSLLVVLGVGLQLDQKALWRFNLIYLRSIPEMSLMLYTGLHLKQGSTIQEQLGIACVLIILQYSGTVWYGIKEVSLNFPSFHGLLY